MLKPQRILELIESNKLTKKAFCDKVDISEQTLANVLRGSDIGSKKLERIAIFFGVSMDYFFENEISTHPNIGHSVNGKDCIEGTKPQSENITIGKKFICSEAYSEIDYQEAKAQSERVKTEIKNLLSLILKE